MPGRGPRQVRTLAIRVGAPRRIAAVSAYARFSAMRRAAVMEKLLALAPSRAIRDRSGAES